jgi:hypothetical protein
MTSPKGSSIGSINERRNTVLSGIRALDMVHQKLDKVITLLETQNQSLQQQVQLGASQGLTFSRQIPANTSHTNPIATTPSVNATERAAVTELVRDTAASVGEVVSELKQRFAMPGKGLTPIPDE